jgi:hypothetical protein
LGRYRKTKLQLETDSFEPAGFVIDIVVVPAGSFWTRVGRLSGVHRNLPQMSELFYRVNHGK